MKYLRNLQLLSLIFISSLFLGTQAHSADLGSLKDDPVAYTPAFSWTGAYVGLHAGFGVGDTQGNINDIPIDLSSDYDVNGALYGGQIGYNWQTGNLVLGIAGSLSGSEIDGTDGTCQDFIIITADCERELNWLATLTGKIGFASGRTMIYAMGGIAWGEIETNVDVNVVLPPIIVGTVATINGEETHTGWVAGLGIQHALTKNLIIGIEYAHIDLGDEDQNLSINGTPLGLSSDVEMEIDTINLSVNWKF